MIKGQIKNVPVASVKPIIRQQIVEQKIIPTNETIDLTVKEVHDLPPAVENFIINLNIELIEIN